jgi:hypothetical protein
MRVIGRSVALVAALALGGCTGDAAPSASKAPTAASASSPAAERAAAQRTAAGKEARTSAVFQECTSVARPLQTSLDDLSSRLSIGLDFYAYWVRVGSARSSYDRLLRDAKSRGGISQQCIEQVAVPLESALNAYITAYNTWNGCLQVASCTFEEGSAPEKKAHASWTEAHEIVTRAEVALAGLRP